MSGLEEIVNMMWLLYYQKTYPRRMYGGQRSIKGNLLEFSLAKRNNNSASKYNEPSILIHHERTAIGKSKKAGASKLWTIQPKSE
jgi:hypothetical protein